MRSRKTAFAFSVFLAAAIFCLNSAQAQTQYAYPGETYANTNLGARPTYQYHYPAASSSTYPMQQYPAASSSAYPSNQYQPAQAAQPQYQPQQTQPTQYQQPQYQTAQAAPQPYQPAQPTEMESSGGVQQLPSYQYNQQLDPRYQPAYHQGGTANSSLSTDGSGNYGHPYLSLETSSGLDLTAQLSYYRYSEPSLSVTEKSSDPFLGLNARGTLVFGHGFYVAAEGRYAFVDIDYTGSGEIDDRSVTSWEWRGLFGKDFLFQQFSLTPYTGFGYRTLFNDNRGITSTGAAGYRRYNQLYYLPIGIQPRTHIDSNARLTSSLEYDFLIHGLQKSDLADAGLGDPNVKNVQSSGYGLRGDIMYETRSWAVGPYFMYWSIDDSKTKLAQDNSVTTCGNAGFSAPCTLIGDEPANHTIEVGVQFRYHFF